MYIIEEELEGEDGERAVEREALLAAMRVRRRARGRGRAAGAAELQYWWVNLNGHEGGEGPSGSIMSGDQLLLTLALAVTAAVLQTETALNILEIGQVLAGDQLRHGLTLSRAPRIGAGGGG